MYKVESIQSSILTTYIHSNTSNTWMSHLVDFLVLFSRTPFRSWSFWTDIVTIKYELYQNLGPLRSIWKAPESKNRGGGRIYHPLWNVGLTRYESNHSTGIVVVGEGAGANIATRFASIHSSRIQGMLLINCKHAPSSFPTKLKVTLKFVTCPYLGTCSS